MFSKYWNLKFLGLPKFFITFLNVIFNKVLESLNSVFWTYNLRECGRNCTIQKRVVIRYPRNIYFNWEDYIKTKNGYDNYFYICSNTIEELQYQIERRKT